MRQVKTAQTGFTIIEIMVAMLLLSSGLVAIFAAQFASIASTKYARNITQATQLGKCKMSELELLFIEEGFQEGDIEETGECCEFMEGESFTEFQCEWLVETVTFPEMDASSIDAEEENSGVGQTSATGSLGTALGGTSGGAMGGMADMGSMELDMISAVMPMITGLLEQAIRRVTVRVRWTEGNLQKDFELIQYVTHPSQGPLKLMQQLNSADAVQSQLNSTVTGGNSSAAPAGSSTRGN